MIDVINGNILNCSENIIVHQTNCLGVMGAGLALQLRKKYPIIFDKYKILCDLYKKFPNSLMGYTQIVNVDNSKYVMNCFGQLSYGTGLQTDYESLKLSLNQVKEYAEYNNLSVAIPYKIGCGLAGGDWNIVYKIIEDIFAKSPIKCVLYKYGDN